MTSSRSRVPRRPPAASGGGGAGLKPEPEDVLGTSSYGEKQGPAGAAAGDGRA